MRWWRRYAGVRVRSTLAAATIVATALCVAGLAGWWLARRTLAGEARDDVGSRSLDVAAQVERQGVAGIEAARRNEFGEIIQVLDGAGRPLAAAPAADLTLRLPLRHPLPRPGRSVTAEVPDPRPFTAGEPYVLVARGVRDGVTHADVVVVVGRSVAGLAQSVGVVGNLGIVGLPLLVVLTGAVTYVFTGRALAPVEEMTRRVRSITARRLDERVPVPAVRDEIGRLAETMNGMLASLQSAQAAQRRFVADAGHELRSPLATIVTTLEVARAGAAPSSEVARLVDGLAPEAARMQRLVEDLLLLARADERGLRLRATDVDLDDVVEAEARRLRSDGGTVAVDVRTAPVRVTGDPDRLAQVVRNLADNARRHARTRVALQVRREGGQAVVRVEDDGAGVPVADRSRVFERFVRLDASRERSSGGAGLGLAIVREIVAGHRGQVSIRSGTLGGALVEVTLPAEEVPADELPDGELPEGQPPSGSSR